MNTGSMEPQISFIRTKNEKSSSVFYIFKLSIMMRNVNIISLNLLFALLRGFTESPDSCVYIVSASDSMESIKFFFYVNVLYLRINFINFHESVDGKSITNI